jgi:DME family drug/metabolite transporter
MSSMQSREWAGTALALAAAVAFALANALAGLAYQGGSDPLTVAAFRFVLPTVALVIWLAASSGSLTLPVRSGWIAVALGVVTAAYTWALLSAIGTIPLGLAILVFYLFPLVASVILAVFGWERLGWVMIAAIVLAFAGLALALDPLGGKFRFDGVLLALAAAIGLGIVVAVSSRVFHGGDSRPVTLYMAAVAASLLIAFCVASTGFAFPRTGFGWIGFLGSAACYAFAMIGFFIAISMIGPTRTSLLSYAEPVIAAGLGVVLLGEVLSLIQIAGIALVIAALVGATLWAPRAH